MTCVGLAAFVAIFRRPLTRPSGTLSPLPRAEGEEWSRHESGINDQWCQYQLFTAQHAHRQRTGSHHTTARWPRSAGSTCGVGGIGKKLSAPSRIRKSFDHGKRGRARKVSWGSDSNGEKNNDLHWNFCSVDAEAGVRTVAEWADASASSRGTRRRFGAKTNAVAALRWTTTRTRSSSVPTGCRPPSRHPQGRRPLSIAAAIFGCPSGTCRVASPRRRLIPAKGVRRKKGTHQTTAPEPFS